MNNKIKEIREEKEIKLVELARRTNLSEGYISHLEKGGRENPTYNTMKKIAKALGEKITKVFEIE